MKKKYLNLILVILLIIILNCMIFSMKNMPQFIKEFANYVNILGFLQIVITGIILIEIKIKKINTLLTIMGYFLLTIALISVSTILIIYILV
jgi:hypothetical protein